MIDVQITSEISQKEYTRFLYLMTYRKPLIIIISLFGLLLLVLSVLYFFNLYSLAEKPPYFPLMTGLFIVFVFPFSILLAARRNFKSEIFLHEAVHYTFTNDKVFMRGDSFSISFEWNKIYKISYLRNWLLFYEDKTRLNFILKNSFTQEQQKEFNQYVKLNRLL